MWSQCKGLTVWEEQWHYNLFQNSEFPCFDSLSETNQLKHINYKVLANNHNYHLAARKRNQNINYIQLTYKWTLYLAYLNFDLRTSRNMIYLSCHFRSSRRCSAKKLLLKISQNSKENTCAVNFFWWSCRTTVAHVLLCDFYKNYTSNFYLTLMKGCFSHFRKACPTWKRMLITVTSFKLLDIVRKLDVHKTDTSSKRLMYVQFTSYIQGEQWCFYNYLRRFYLNHVKPMFHF